MNIMRSGTGLYSPIIIIYIPWARGQIFPTVKNVGVHSGARLGASAVV